MIHFFHSEYDRSIHLVTSDLWIAGKQVNLLPNSQIFNEVNFNFVIYQVMTDQFSTVNTFISQNYDILPETSLNSCYAHANSYYGI